MINKCASTIKNLLIPDKNFTARPFLTEKNRDRVINNNFEIGKRGDPIWFRDICCKYNYRAVFNVFVQSEATFLHAEGLLNGYILYTLSPPSPLPPLHPPPPDSSDYITRWSGCHWYVVMLPLCCYYWIK